MSRPKSSPTPPEAPPIPPGGSAKRCPGCERVLPHSEFYRDRHNRPAAAGLMPYCKWCSGRRNGELQRRNRLRKYTTPELRRALELARNKAAQIEAILRERGEQE